ncbi:MAG: enoyl-CoA hydratase-related protein, partial [Anaerolineae bacterium]
MKTYDALAITVTLPFAHVTLNRPEVKNAMNTQMVLDLSACFEALRDRRDVRAVVLSGAGGTFCAGGDIKEMAQAVEAGQADTFSEALERLLRLINEAPQVVIAKVEGAAMGGGLGLVCVSDIALARADATFALPEVRLGIAPAIISPYVIERVGLTRARELMLTGRRFMGDEAQKYGIIHDACLPNELEDRISLLLEQLKQCSPN